MTNSKGKATKQNDHWLTPPEIINILGPFNMDVCCPIDMPWSTARHMITEKQDGLKIKWVGKVWCNPPYSKILPWAVRMNDHRNGFMLVPAKSTDTKWAQEILQGSDAVLFLKGRISYCYLDGTQSKGAWSSYMIAAWGKTNVNRLIKFMKIYPGTLMTREI